MEAYVVETPVGLFIVDESGKLLDKALFSRDPRKAAVEMKQYQEGRLWQEILDSVKRVGSSYSPIVFENKPAASAAEQQLQLKTTVKPAKQFEDFRSKIRSDWRDRDRWMRQQMLDVPILKNPRAYNEFTRKVTLEIARAGVAQAVASKDLSAVQAVRSMDDLDKTMNLLAGRIREWYGLHFPEADRLIEKHDTYARLIAKLGNRRNFTFENLTAEGIPKERAKDLAESAGSSMGAEMDDSDLAVVQSLCGLLLDLNKFREKTETYVEAIMKQAAPNMTSLVGAALAARLISIAGGLDNLAKMPASTMQVLGAEKALFRSLKTGARPPKHGVIFQYTPIHQAPRWQRGKIARTLSGKLSIAARVDAYGGDFMGDKLRAGLDVKITEIKERYKTPPPPKKKEFGRKR